VARHCYTPDTARSALGALRPIAETVSRLVGQMEQARPRRIVSDQPVDQAYFDLLTRLQVALGEIRRRGVKIDDLKRGRLGFPARRNGRPVLLCWEVGETTLGFWNEPGEGLAVRRPVDEGGPWEEG